MADKSWGFSTRAVHVGQGPDPATGAVVQPIHLATTFAQQGVGRHQGYEYSRSGNPTRSALEECLAGLEDAKHALAFASGLGAESTLLLLLKPNDHVVYMEDVYGGTYRLFDKVMHRFGITFTAVDASDLDAVESAITPSTRLVWLESPSNPLLRIVDIDAVSEIAHGHDAKVCVDNTFATPFLQQPLHLGAVESLAEHPARMTHASMPASERKRAGVGDGLIRLSIGVEDAADLVTDLEDALSAAHA